VSEGGRRDSNPLVERVHALLRRHQDAAPGSEDDVPVLTEVAAPGAAEALALELERAVLERLHHELQPMLADALRAAVAAAVKRELEARKLDAESLAGKRPASSGD
jgi:hypothetical protein